MDVDFWSEIFVCLVSSSMMFETTSYHQQLNNSPIDVYIVLGHIGDITVCFGPLKNGNSSKENPINVMTKLLLYYAINAFVQTTFS